jgi:hypothetical protein
MKAERALCKAVPIGRLLITCQRWSVRDGYCYAHHPDTIARKIKERRDRELSRDLERAPLDEDLARIDDLVDGIGTALGLDMAEVSESRLLDARKEAKRRLWPRLRLVVK